MRVRNRLYMLKAAVHSSPPTMVIQQTLMATEQMKCGK